MRKKRSRCRRCSDKFILKVFWQVYCSSECRKKQASFVRPGERLNRRKEILRIRGLTLEEYALLLLKQNQRCAICKKEESRLDGTKSGRIKVLSVDHDHKTNLVRGLLCGKCNSGMGFFNDNASLLKKAIVYLENHTKEVIRNGRSIEKGQTERASQEIGC